MGQPAIGAGGDVEEVEPAGEQKGIETVGRSGALLTAQGVVVEESGTRLLVGLEQAPGKQGAHVELAHPGGFEHRQGQRKTQLLASHRLGPFHEVIVVLERRETLEHRHDPVEGGFGAGVVGEQGLVGGQVGQGVEP